MYKLTTPNVNNPKNKPTILSSPFSKEIQIRNVIVFQ